MRKPRVKLRAKGAQRCPLCRVQLVPDTETHSCSSCGVLYHRDCLHEMGGCATLGCDRAGVAPEAPTPTLQTRRARWGRVRDAARERRRDRRHMRALHQEEFERALANPELRQRLQAPEHSEAWVTWSGVGRFLLFLLEVFANCLIFVVVLFAGLLRLLVEVV